MGGGQNGQDQDGQDQDSQDQDGQDQDGQDQDGQDEDGQAPSTLNATHFIDKMLMLLGQIGLLSFDMVRVRASPQIYFPQRK